MRLNLLSVFLPPNGPLSARQLRHRYHATLLLCGVLLVAAISAYGWSTYQRERAAVLVRLHGQGEQLQLALTEKIDLARAHVFSMRHSVERGLRQPALSDVGFAERIERRNLSPLRDAPWERLPQELAVETGSLHVDPSASLDWGSLRRDASAASSMLAEVAATHKWHKAFQRSYYYDAQKRWGMVFPQQSRTDLFAATATGDMGSALRVLLDANGTVPLDAAGPQSNPQRESVWTRPHPQNATSQTLVATLLAPVYAGDGYLGTVGTDVDLSLLNAALQQLPLLVGRALVVDASGQVLAESGSTKSAKGEVPQADAGPDPAWMRFALRGTPWTLLVHAPSRLVSNQALAQLKPFWVMAPILLVALFALAFVQSRRYMLPVLQLVEYMEQIETAPRKLPPHAPPFWKPWFERVSRSALERREQLATALLKTKQLETMVANDTAELRGAHAQLSAALDTVQKTQCQLAQTGKLATLTTRVSGAAHELATPVGTALLATIALKERRSTLLQQLQTGLRRADLDGFLADVEQANTVVENNLNAAHQQMQRFKGLTLRAASETTRPLNLRDATSRAVAAVQETIQRPGVTIVNAVPKDLEVTTSDAALGEVLGNLIGNALTHAFAGRSEGLVRLHAEPHRRENGDDVVRMTIQDNGTGIPAHVLSRLLVPPADQGTTPDGMGLGLTVVQYLVEDLLGGSIQVSSTSAGTLFTMELPLTMLPNAPQSHPPKVEGFPQ